MSENENVADCLTGRIKAAVLAICGIGKPDQNSLGNIVNNYFQDMCMLK